MKSLFLFILGVTAYSNLLAQTPKTMLLSDQKVQFECTQAIDSLYNFNFEAAEKQFRWIRQSYPDHPLPYFLMALSNWWKIVPNDELRDFDDTFFAYLDSTIDKADELHDLDKSNPEPLFFLAAAYGFKARRQADNGDIMTSAFTARKSLEYMHIESSDELFSPEFLFGDGLYNYYREYLWNSSDHKYLKTVLMLFRKGDIDLGIEQLNRVKNEAFYSRIEAMYHLMEIYGYHWAGNRSEGWSEALELAISLADQYPNNAYFNMVAAEMALKRGNRKAMLKYAAIVMKGVNSGKFGYSAEAGRKASFVLSKYYPYDSQERITALRALVEFADKAQSLDKCYTINSCEVLARHEDKQGNVENALHYCFIIVDNSSKDDCKSDPQDIDRKDKKEMTRKEWKKEKEEIKEDNRKLKESGPYQYAEKYIDEHTEKSWYEFW